MSETVVYSSNVRMYTEISCSTAVSRFVDQVRYVHKYIRTYV